MNCNSPGTGADRCFWIPLSALWNHWPKCLVIIKPATVLRWRRDGIWKCWRRGKGRRKPGGPPLNAELVSLIEQISRSNFLWGAPRIHSELLKLGLEVSQATVAKYMVPRRLRRGPGWHVFLRNELAGLPQGGVSLALKGAWSALKGIWAGGQWLSNGLETRLVLGPGSRHSVPTRMRPRRGSAFLRMDWAASPESGLGKPFEVQPVGGQARDSPARPLNSENPGRQIGRSELACKVEVYDERCAA